MMNDPQTSQDTFTENVFRPSLSALEAERILYSFNQTEWIAPDPETLIAKFERQAQQHPQHVAVQFMDQRLSYRQLDEQSNQLAHYLIVQGIQPGALVPVWLDRSLAWLIAVTAILKAGAAYVPIDPNYPPNRVAYMLADTRASLLITDQQLVHRIGERNDITVCLADLQETYAGQPVTRPETYAGINDLAYVIYTSVPPGHPKALWSTTSRYSTW